MSERFFVPPLLDTEQARVVGWLSGAYAGRPFAWFSVGLGWRGVVVC